MNFKTWFHLRSLDAFGEMETDEIWDEGRIVIGIFNKFAVRPV